MTKPGVRYAPLAAAVALLAFLSAPPARAAVQVTKVGWWTRSPAAPAVSAGGVAVGQAPDGNLSVAAFEVDTRGGASGAQLTLTESGGQGQQAAALQACTTADGWAAVSGGDLRVAPRPTCPSSPVALTRDANGAWTASLDSLLAGKTGPVSVMVIPAAAAAALPAGTQPGAFQIAFAPPAVAGTTKAPVETDSGAFAPIDSTADSPLPEYFPEVAAPNAILPAPATDGAAPAVNTAPLTPSGGAVSFPVRDAGTPTKHASRTIIILWFVIASAVGAIAAAWHWAREAGLMARLVPWRTGGNLLPPPPG